MATDWLTLNDQRLLRFGESNEFNWNYSALVQKLEETVLTVRSWFTKIYYSRLVVDLLTFCVYSFAIALHVQLLNVWCELAQGLAIWNNCSGRVILDHCSVKS